MVTPVVKMRPHPAGTSLLASCKGGPSPPPPGREALGCVWAVERLHNYLFGIEFTRVTGNKPLSSMFDPYSSKVLPPRIQRLAWRLHQYSFRMQYIAGNANTEDSLSRLPSKFIL